MKEKIKQEYSEKTPENLLYFCLGASREERDVCLLHVGMPGQEGCYTEIVSL